MHALLCFPSSTPPLHAIHSNIVQQSNREVSHAQTHIRPSQHKQSKTYARHAMPTPAMLQALYAVSTHRGRHSIVYLVAGSTNSQPSSEERVLLNPRSTSLTCHAIQPSIEPMRSVIN
ncbi:hypothetical protein BU26DRAFT_186401 [Trematosphaeria pertusa]|uniref:Uncharacterized protein n=1 Tax=Trematosphaeria pertusa TaxID=390896 RepID=A0A6A6HS88_9PLEO|nr:uncharacterized protein BU26DRAFT_186401 [Trematosphaeria pertusa]KAF2241035.1 hypothetical protein BU26DRAFT_186401 [Trematosphaeria pertusa]